MAQTIYDSSINKSGIIGKKRTFSEKSWSRFYSNRTLAIEPS